jgi:predicted alpha/beta-fold hydrolase
VLRTCTTETEAERRKLEIAKLVERLRESGYTSVIPNLRRCAAPKKRTRRETLALLTQGAR